MTHICGDPCPRGAWPTDDPHPNCTLLAPHPEHWHRSYGIEWHPGHRLSRTVGSGVLVGRVGWRRRLRAWIHERTAP